MTESLESTHGWMDAFVTEQGITQSGLTQDLTSFLEGAQNKLDYFGSFSGYFV